MHRKPNHRLQPEKKNQIEVSSRHFLQYLRKDRQILFVRSSVFKTDVEIARFFPEGKVVLSMKRQGEDALSPSKISAVLSPWWTSKSKMRIRLIPGRPKATSAHIAKSLKIQYPDPFHRGKRDASRPPCYPQEENPFNTPSSPSKAPPTRRRVLGMISFFQGLSPILRISFSLKSPERKRSTICSS